MPRCYQRGIFFGIAFHFKFQVRQPIGSMLACIPVGTDGCANAFATVGKACECDDVHRLIQVNHHPKPASAQPLESDQGSVERPRKVVAAYALTGRPRVRLVSTNRRAKSVPVPISMLMSDDFESLRMRNAATMIFQIRSQTLCKRLCFPDCCETGLHARSPFTAEKSPHCSLLSRAVRKRTIPARMNSIASADGPAAQIPASPNSAERPKVSGMANK